MAPGRRRTLALGAVAAVNFWATWCAPCREEIPMLMGVREVYAHSGMEFIGIAIDLAPKVVEYARSLEISYPILVLGNSARAWPKGLT